MHYITHSVNRPHPTIPLSLIRGPQRPVNRAGFQPTSTRLPYHQPIRPLRGG